MSTVSARTMAAVLLTGHGGLEKLDHRPCAYSTAENVRHRAAAGAERVLVTGSSGGVGLTPGRRQRDLRRAAGPTISVQDTVGSPIAFAAILHLGATPTTNDPATTEREW